MNHMPYLKEGEFAILPKEAVLALIEVKTNLNKKELHRALKCLHSPMYHNWKFPRKNPWTDKMHDQPITDGTEQSDLAGQSTIGTGIPEGTEITVTVIPNDGEIDGKPAFAEVTVVNAPPTTEPIDEQIPLEDEKITDEQPEEEPELEKPKDLDMTAEVKFQGHIPGFPLIEISGLPEIPDKIELTNLLGEVEANLVADIYDMKREDDEITAQAGISLSVQKTKLLDSLESKVEIKNKNGQFKLELEGEGNGLRGEIRIEGQMTNGFVVEPIAKVELTYKQNTLDALGLLSMFRLLPQFPQEQLAEVLKGLGFGGDIAGITYQVDFKDVSLDIDEGESKGTMTVWILLNAGIISAEDTLTGKVELVAEGTTFLASVKFVGTLVEKAELKIKGDLENGVVVNPTAKLEFDINDGLLPTDASAQTAEEKDLPKDKIIKEQVEEEFEEDKLEENESEEKPGAEAEEYTSEASKQSVREAQKLAKKATIAFKKAKDLAEKAAKKSQIAEEKAKKAADEASRLAAEKAKKAAEKAKEAKDLAEQAAKRAGKEATDINDDGINNIFDLVFVAKFFGKKFTSVEEEGAISDINGDGVIDIKDLVLTARGLTDGIPIPTEEEKTAASPSRNANKNIWLKINQNKSETIDNKALRIDMMADGMQDMYAFQFELRFEPDVLEAVEIEEVVLLGSDGTATYWHSFKDVKAGIIRATCTRLVSEGISENGSLANITFRIKRDSWRLMTPLKAVTLKISDSRGNIVESNLVVKGLDFEKVLAPYSTKLLQNYPNPFNPETWIPFKLSDDANVIISIFDVKGQLVRKFELGQKQAGLYFSKDKAVYWDGKNRYGEKVSSELYFYTLQAGDYIATKRMLILK